jgi:hypothetical protein
METTWLTELSYIKSKGKQAAQIQHKIDHFSDSSVKIVLRKTITGRGGQDASAAARQYIHWNDVFTTGRGVRPWNRCLHCSFLKR